MIMMTKPSTNHTLAIHLPFLKFEIRVIVNGVHY